MWRYTRIILKYDFWCKCWQLAYIQLQKATANFFGGRSFFVGVDMQKNLDPRVADLHIKHVLAIIPK